VSRSQRSKSNEIAQPKSNKTEAQTETETESEKGKEKWKRALSGPGSVCCVYAI